MALPVGRTAKTFVGAFVLVLAVLITRPAVAGAEARTVEVVATGEPSATSAVEALVRELLNRLPVVIRWVYALRIDPHDVLARRPADAGVAARVWVDLSDPAGPRLFVANAASDHFLVRLVPAGDGHVEVEQEAVAQIIGFAVEAMLTGGEIGVTREAAVREILAQPNRANAPPPELAAGAVQPPPFRDGLSGKLGVFAGLRALGAGPAISVDPGLLATVSGPRRGSIQPLLLLELQYEAPLDWQTHAVAVRLEGGGGSLQGGLQARVGSRVSIRASAGLGADAMYVQPHAAAGSTFTARGSFWLAAMVATARVGFEVALAAPVSLFASAGCDLDVSGVRFTVSDSGSAEPNVVPWGAWPVAQIGVNFSLNQDLARPP